MLRGADCEYQESMDRLEKSKILIISLKNTYGGLSSKMLLLSPRNVEFPRNSRKLKSRFYLIKYAKVRGKIGKILDICINTICNGLKQNKLRIIAVPFFFHAIVFFSFIRLLCGFRHLLK